MPFWNRESSSGRIKKNTPSDFWNKVDKVSSDVYCNGTRCWIWTGAIRKSSGYGSTTVNYKQYGAHSYSYILTYGEIKDGLCVLHHCDNRSCVNPEHLFLGTKHDNAMDMVSKLRGLHGTKHPLSKLTEENVSEIRNLYSSGDYSYEQLANIFLVSKNTIRQVVKNIKWKHVA